MDQLTPGRASPYAPAQTPRGSNPYKAREQGEFQGRLVQQAPESPAPRLPVRPAVDHVGGVAVVGGPGGPPLWATAEAADSLAPEHPSPAAADAPIAPGASSLSPGGPPREAPEVADAPAGDKKSRAAVRREQRQRSADRAKQQAAARAAENRLDHKHTSARPVTVAAPAAKSAAEAVAPNSSVGPKHPNAALAALAVAASMPPALLFGDDGAERLAQAGAAVLPSGQLESELDVLFAACDSNHELFDAVCILDMLKHKQISQLIGSSAPPLFQRTVLRLATLSDSHLDKYTERVFATPAMFPKSRATLEPKTLFDEMERSRGLTMSKDAKSAGTTGVYVRCIRSIDRVLLKKPLEMRALTASMPFLSLLLQAARTFEARGR